MTETGTWQLPHQVTNEKVPNCCIECRFHEIVYNADRIDPYHYCGLNLFIPIKKQTCKRQKKWFEND